MSDESALPPAIPAATLVLMRPAPHGPPELLMMERTGDMAFAAGALVFPGGRIDPADEAAATLLAPNLADGAARIAAVRETIEESGLAPALVPAADPAAAAALRQGLEAEEDFAELLGRHGLALDLAALTPFTRWCPAFRHARRFDTVFYLAEAPPDAAPASAAAAEAVRVFWASAQAVIADLDAGRAHAIFPTRRNLERLARFGSIGEARADAARHPVETITPWVERRDGRDWVCIPEGIGYPVTAEPLDSAMRA